MSNDGRDEDMGIVDKVVEKVGEVFGFNDIKNEIQILKDTSDDIQKEIKKLATNNELKAIKDIPKISDDAINKIENNIKNLKEDLKIEVVSDFEEKFEPILKNYAEQYLERRNDKYLDEYKKIESYVISAKEETIALLKKDKENFEKDKKEFKDTLQGKKEEIEKLKEKIQDLKNQLSSNSNLSEDLKEAQKTIESLKSQLNSEKEGADGLQAKNDDLSQDLEKSQERIENLNSQLNTKQDELNALESEKRKLSHDLKEVEETIKSLNSQLNSKQTALNNSEGDKGKLSQDLEKAQKTIKDLNSQLSSKQSELDNLESKKTESEKDLSNAMSKIFTLESTIKEKEKEIESLENKSKKDKESTLSEREEIENRLQDFIKKIEAPYEGLLKAIAKNSKSKEIEEYLKFKNDRELSKSMIIFSLINEDALARKIASFYGEKKEIMMDEDFEIIKEVNKIYENDKPWGILYAEPEGQYLSSLVRDRKSSDIYKTFVAMYSPAYRKDEDGNSPLKGIVDGKK